MRLKSIHEVFKNRIYRIPSYQRGYSWANNTKNDEPKGEDFKDTKGQLMDLWSDISNLPSNSWHYIGVLTLIKVSSLNYSWLNCSDNGLNSKYEQFSIVDGQQRITSLLILVAVIIEQADELDLDLGSNGNDPKSQYLYVCEDSLTAYIFGYDEDNPSDKYFRKHILGNDDEVEDDSRESVYTRNLKEAKPRTSG